MSAAARSCLQPALALLWALAVLVRAFPASAMPVVELPEGFSAVMDLRLIGVDGERSWIDGGFGKARFGAGADDFDLEPVVANAELVWEPSLTWNLDSTLVVAFQDGQEQPFDVVEAFVSWRPVPRSATRFSARAGLFWPPVSLEHEGAAWSVAGMITPSAINSWIGEEVKVVGLEGTATHEFDGGGRLSGTFGLFGYNDTAGTLLAFRGWALHDEKTTAFSDQPLPPLSDFMVFSQAPATSPTVEIDDRPGYYGRLSLQLAAPVSLEAFYYRNRGVPEAINKNLQWGWDTRFLNLGARIDLGPRTRLIAQGLTGRTEMGIEENDHYWVDTKFRSAFLRLTHEIGRATLSGRVDLFDTEERGSQMEVEESADGWALTGAVDWRLSTQAELIFEALHIDSDRGVRTRVGLAPSQEQNVVQVALRLTL